MPWKDQVPDQVCIFLKETASKVTPMLTHLFQQSLSYGTVPIMTGRWPT